ncbi:MAG: cystathionine gamma-synthase [Gammaproteobacteria bacterium]|nr:cystathionine gamma-synthase [Gammaproteobacteria bacterium]MYC53314.1 cystathionine gamma-synthase [Gammaproteobacteria bacterium]
MKEHCTRDRGFAGSDLGATTPGPDGRGRIPARATEVVRAGLASDTAYGAVMPPLYLSSNFRFAGLEDPPPYDYTRSGNPTREHLTGALAQLEGGADAVATSSGMSAVGVVLNLVHADDLVLAPHDCYGGTHRLLVGLERQGRLRVRFVDFTDPASLAAGLEQEPRMIWVETPSNPLLRITDLAAVAREARRAGAIAVADNTFLSPALQQPIDFGFDLVVHSTTKFINGHSDLVGGAVIAAGDELFEEIAWWTNATGAAQSPFDSYLALRGVRTLFARTRIHEENTSAVVDLLASHPAVARVYYPGLTTHPGHDLASRQQCGYGSLFSFELKGGRAAADELLARLRLFTLAESLGGVESLICHPATMTHAAMDEAAQAVAGIGKGLLRVSVGIESADDLVADLGQALSACRAAVPEGGSHAADVVPIGSVAGEPGLSRASIGGLG